MQYKFHMIDVPSCYRHERSCSSLRNSSTIVKSARRLLCSSLKFISEASQFNVVLFCVLNLFLLGIHNHLSLFCNSEIFVSEPS